LKVGFGEVISSTKIHNKWLLQIVRFHNGVFKRMIAFYSLRSLQIVDHYIGSTRFDDDLRLYTAIL